MHSSARPPPGHRNLLTVTACVAWYTLSHLPFATVGLGKKQICTLLDCPAAPQCAELQRRLMYL